MQCTVAKHDCIKTIDECTHYLTLRLYKQPPFLIRFIHLNFKSKIAG